jgi:hypothetical protein
VPSDLPVDMRTRSAHLRRRSEVVVHAARPERGAALSDCPDAANGFRRL